MRRTNASERTAVVEGPSHCLLFDLQKGDQMPFKNRRVDKRTVVEVDTRDLDASIATDFKNYLIHLFEQEPEAAVIVDLSKVRFIDSTCLGALLAAYRHNGSAKKLAVAEPQEPVQHVFKMARLAKAMPIYETVVEALLMTSGEWPGRA